MKGALVIRYGDPETAAAIENGMRIAEQKSNREIEAIRAELAQMRQNAAPLAVRQIRDSRYFREKIAEAEADYGWIQPSRNPVANALWGVYGLIVEKVDDWFDWFFDQIER